MAIKECESQECGTKMQSEKMPIYHKCQICELYCSLLK